MQNVQGDAAGKIMSFPHMLGERKREGWCVPTGPRGRWQKGSTEAAEENFLCLLSFLPLTAAALQREAQDAFGESLAAQRLE